jgi:hypothetical protein
VLERAAATAATLLATVSFALIALVLQLQSGTVRWPDVTLVLLVAAGICLVGCVQAILWAEGDSGSWASFARTLYNIGTLLLIAAVAMLLVPGGKITATRLVAIVVAGAGFAGELVWICLTFRLGRRGSTRAKNMASLQQALDPAMSESDRVAVRKWLASIDVKSGKDALEKSEEIGHPIGVADMQAATGPAGQA